MTIGTDGLGLISYRGDASLKVAHCTNVSCSSADLFTVDPFGGRSSITIGSDGLGLIAYSSSTLRVAHCTDIPCSSATTVAIGTSNDEVSVTIGTDGLPVISHKNGSNLELTHCANILCAPYWRRR